MILCTDYLTCNSFGDQDRCGYTEKEKQRKRLKVSGGARKLLCFIHLAVHGITGDIIIECGQGPHRGPVLRSFTGCWKQRSFFSFSFNTKYFTLLSCLHDFSKSDAIVNLFPPYVKCFFFLWLLWKFSLCFHSLKFKCVMSRFGYFDI